MTVMVEIPKFNMSDVIPDAPDRVHPAFIGPDGVVLDSVQIELEPWVALSILRSLRCLYEDRVLKMAREKSMVLSEYQRMRWAIIMLTGQIKELEGQIRNEAETT